MFNNIGGSYTHTLRADTSVVRRNCPPNVFTMKIQVIATWFLKETHKKKFSTTLFTKGGVNK